MHLFKYLLSGVLTMADEIFWSIKMRSDKAKPNPMAPAMARTERRSNGVTVKTFSLSS